MGKEMLCVEWLGGHPVHNCSQVVRSALRLLVFRQQGGRLQHPVPLELMRQAANIPVSMSQLLGNNSPNLNKLHSVGREIVKE